MLVALRSFGSNNLVICLIYNRNSACQGLPSLEQLTGSTRDPAASCVLHVFLGLPVRHLGDEMQRLVENVMLIQRC